MWSTNVWKNCWVCLDSAVEFEDIYNHVLIFFFFFFFFFNFLSLELLFDSVFVFCVSEVVLKDRRFGGVWSHLHMHLKRERGGMSCPPTIEPNEECKGNCIIVSSLSIFLAPPPPFFLMKGKWRNISIALCMPPHHLLKWITSLFHDGTYWL